MNAPEGTAVPRVPRGESGLLVGGWAEVGDSTNSGEQHGEGRERGSGRLALVPAAGGSAT